jgi:hypothetical protein
MLIVIFWRGNANFRKAKSWDIFDRILKVRQFLNSENFKNRGSAAEKLNKLTESIPFYILKFPYLLSKYLHFHLQYTNFQKNAVFFQKKTIYQLGPY